MNTHPRDRIMLLGRIGSTSFRLTAGQILDTIASYLATGATLPPAHPAPGDDPFAGYHLICEQWTYEQVAGYVAITSAVTLADQRARAQTWCEAFFGPTFPTLVTPALIPATDAVVHPAAA